MAPTLQSAKKMPMRLGEKLRESQDPIVGLRYIVEIIACSSTEVEPNYECYICDNIGEANGMYNHIFGKPHRLKFLQKKFPNDPR